MSAPYYIAVHGGFLVAESYDTHTKGEVTKVYTVANVREADTWDTFDQADAMAKYAVGRLYPPDLRYFALLEVARG